MIILSLSVKPNYIFIILLLIFVTPQISNARGDLITIEIEPTVLGAGINSVNWAPYRIDYKTREVYPVLYPEPLNGKLSVDASNLPPNIEISVVVVMNLTITEEDVDAIITIRLRFILLNSTLIEGKNYFNLDEIDHLSGVSIAHENGSIIPKSSYYYAEELKPGTIIYSTISIFFEQSDHTKDWDVQFGIEGELVYTGDEVFYIPLPTASLNSSTNSGIPFYFNFLLLVPLAKIAGRDEKKN